MNYRKLAVALCGGLLLYDLSKGVLHGIYSGVKYIRNEKGKSAKGKEYDHHGKEKGTKMRKIGFGEAD